MKVGVFTPLLSQLPLEDVVKKLKAMGVDLLELGTGNYPGDAHCKLSMLEDSGKLAEFILLAHRATAEVLQIGHGSQVAVVVVRCSFLC